MGSILKTAAIAAGTMFGLLLLNKYLFAFLPGVPGKVSGQP